MSTERIQKTYVKSLRSFRKYHRRLGLILAILLLISAGTGILLSLKKDVAILQPPTQKGQSKDLLDWKSLSELSLTAQTALQKEVPQINPAISKMDVRPSKGIVKVLFKEDHWEVQVDGHSGDVLSVAKRHSDWIEALHDGSIVSDAFKLISMNVLGWGILILVGSGIWLWYGPRLVRRLRK